MITAYAHIGPANPPEYDDEPRPCWQCDGTGIEAHGTPDADDCARCGGTGEEPEHEPAW